MNRIVFFSGGLGSWATARRVINKYGTENVICLFTDTLIEDEDLYRFLLETTQEMYQVDQSDLIERTKSIPPVSKETMEDRKQYLINLAADTRKRNPHFVWINDGRDPWDVFKDVKFLGNSRLANCSHELKQKMSAKFLKGKFSPEDTTLYLGIDWTEEHRTKAPRKNWAPYPVEFPMCEEPYVTKIEVAKELEATGIKRPRLYEMDFEHNNCGGFCVRAGQGHFINLLKHKPHLYRYHEEREQEMREFLDRDVSILKRTKTEAAWVDPQFKSKEEIEWDSVDLSGFYDKEEAAETLTSGYWSKKKVTYRLTLKQLREEYEAGGKQAEQIDMFDVGGCGCFSIDAEVMA